MENGSKKPLTGDMAQWTSALLAAFVLLGSIYNFFTDYNSRINDNTTAIRQLDQRCIGKSEQLNRLREEFDRSHTVEIPDRFLRLETALRELGELRIQFFTLKDFFEELKKNVEEYKKELKNERAFYQQHVIPLLQQSNSLQMQQQIGDK